MNELNVIQQFAQKRILLIGDAILDMYVHARIVGPSLDAPGAYEIEEQWVEKSFGGTGLVAANMLELGGQVSFVTVMGGDEDRHEYDKFEHPNLTKHFFIDDTRRTTVKKSFWADGNKVLQSDQVDNQYISSDLATQISQQVRELIQQSDVMVALDAQHGLLSENLIQQLIKLSHEYEIPFYVDSQISHRPSNHHLYTGVDSILFNLKEIQDVDQSFDVQVPEQSLRNLRQILEINNVVVKLGKQGVLAVINNEYFNVPAHQVEAIDTNGAGDAFVAAFSLGDRQSPAESLALANAWAALSTTVLGTKPAQKQDLIGLYKQQRQTHNLQNPLVVNGPIKKNSGDIKQYQYGLDPDKLSEQIMTPERQVKDWGFYTPAIGLQEYSLQQLFVKQGKSCRVVQALLQEAIIYLESGQVNIRAQSQTGQQHEFNLSPQEFVLLPAGSIYIINSQADSYLYTFVGVTANPQEPQPFEVRPTFDRRQKHWAETQIETIVNKEYTGKKIFFSQGNSSSLHFHCNKKETYFIHSGKLLLRLRAGQGEDRYFILNPGQAITLTPGLMHQTGALEDLTIIEISTHDEDSDSYIVEAETAEMPKLKEMLQGASFQEEKDFLAQSKI